MHEHGYGITKELVDGGNNWECTQTHAEDAISYSDSHVPRPDGIPYMAWPCAGRLADTVLHHIAAALWSAQFGWQMLPKYGHASCHSWLQQTHGHRP